MSTTGLTFAYLSTIDEASAGFTYELVWGAAQGDPRLEGPLGSSGFGTLIKLKKIKIQEQRRFVYFQT